MIFAYADPPYPGMAHRYPERREVDHAELIGRLIAEYRDGWALSTHMPALWELLPLVPRSARVMAWVKPFTAFRPNVGVAYAWEPVIVCGGRKRTRGQATLFDWVSATVTPSREHTVLGKKPTKFCFWLFQVMNMQPGDELHDLFPGSGAVTKAWDAYCRQTVLTP